MQLLETKGWLRLNWEKYEKGNILETIDLVRDQKIVDELNSLLGRIPIEAMRTKLRQLLDAQERDEGWLGAFLSWAKLQLDTHKSPVPLDYLDIQESQDLLHALSAIARLEVPIFERTLSVRLFKDSKRLEELRGRVLTVLRAHDPNATVYEDDEWALLQAHCIKRPPERVPLAGPFHLFIPNISQIKPVSETYLHLDTDISSISLPEDILRSAIVTECTATALVTVENLTSFSELLLVRPRDIIIIHTGGFASPSLLTFLLSIRAHRPDLPFFHWGDLDAGGLRILAHLRRQIGHVISIGMDEETFEKERLYAQPLTPNDKENLMTLLTESTLKDCISLIHHLVTENLKLEQEAIDAKYILYQIKQIF
jgi:hypothetical protein